MIALSWFVAAMLLPQLRLENNFESGEFGRNRLRLVRDGKCKGLLVLRIVIGARLCIRFSFWA